MTTNIRFEDWEAEQMRDPEFREAAEALEPAYQVARLRMLRGLTQEELAKRVGTRQPGIARLESGRKEPRISFLRRIAKELGARLVLQLVPEEQLALAQAPDVTLDAPGGMVVTWTPAAAPSGGPLPDLWQAGPKSPTAIVSQHGVEIHIDITDEPTTYHTKEAILAPGWPRSGAIPWVDHASQTAESEKVS